MRFAKSSGRRKRCFRRFCGRFFYRNTEDCMAQHDSQSESLDTTPRPSGDVESMQFLCEQYRKMLLSSRYAPLRVLSCRIDEQSQKVVVCGELPSFYLKQQAQELLVRSFGITSFSNAIQVAYCSNDQGRSSDSMAITSPNTATFDYQEG
jgi:hypothetical protein